jgi:cytochrome P450
MSRTARPVKGIRELTGVAQLYEHTDVRAAAKDWALFSSDLQGDVDWRSYRQLPLEVDPPRHTLYREIIEPFFEKPRIASLEPELRQIARTAAHVLVTDSRVEAVSQLAIPMVAASACLAFGRPQDSAESMDWGVYAIDIRSDGVRDGSGLERYLDRVLKEAHQDPGDDIFSAIARAQIEGRRLTPLEQRGLGNLIVAAGRDTVILLICGLLWHLAGNTPDRQSLRDKPEMIQLAVEEMLRYLSPLPRMERRVTAPIEASWGQAAAGDIVVLGFLRANHDPTVFDWHDSIDLQRRPNPHLAFGSGPHTCIGLHLARLQARVFLEEFLATGVDWHMEEDSAIDFADVSGASVPIRFRTLHLRAV